MRQSFANGDGTWSVLMHMPGERLLVWDPCHDSLEEVVISADWNSEQNGTTYQLLHDSRGRVYFPHRGWYDPQGRSIASDGPRPQEEMTWFGDLGDCAVGINVQGATASLGLWEYASGAVRLIGSVPECHVQNVTLTASGKIVGISLYGDFFRFDARSGDLEYSRRLPTDAVGSVVCVCRIDDNRILGTTYNTQRFWEMCLSTQQGIDNGRVAPGFGEITRLKKVGSKVYMAAYNGGELLEFNPNLRSRFPENPRVVAAPAGGLRPVGICTDGRHLFYTCSRKYGHLGSTLTRYDTRTGRADNVLNPLPDQQIHSLFYDKVEHRLIAGTTYHADCQSCPPSTNICYFAVLDAETLRPTQTWPAPEGTISAYVCGPVGGGRWVFRCEGTSPDSSQSGTFVFDIRKDALLSADQLKPLPHGTREVCYSGRLGQFFLLFARRIELWDLDKTRLLKLVYCGKEMIQRIAVDGNALLVVLPREVLVMENNYE
ncbi:MAG: hypothetical protein ABI210_05565 [Abditibacteriaceae bacterium]